MDLQPFSLNLRQKCSLIHVDLMFPAGEMRSCFETTFGLARDGKLQKGFETMLRYAVICHDFKDEVRVLQRSERVGVFLFWPLGKLLRYSSKYSGTSVDVPEPDS